MTPRDPIRTIEKWFESLPVYAHTDGLPARGSTAAGLVVLERLKTRYSLDVRSHLAKGGAQIQGLTPSAVRKILLRFDETRPLLKEGGRTNRGTPEAAEALFEALRPLRLEQLPLVERNAVLNELQRWLAGKVRAYFERRRLEIEFDPQLSTWANVRNILNAASAVGKASSVAQYLVGAKLQLRFPEIKVENELASAADLPSGRFGDFEIGDAVFHVTISPGVNVAEKCHKNLSVGKRAVLLVPETALLSARDYVQNVARDRVFVVSVETFVAGNLKELSVFRRSELVSGFRRLLELYNERIDAVESDKSLMIDIPPNLK
jgi:hypothetical protein